MKAIEINGQIKIYSKLPKTWNNILNFEKVSIELQQQEGFYDVVVPEFNTEFQYLGEIYFDANDEVFTYPVIDITQEELDERKEQELDAMDREFDILVTKRLLRTLVQTILDKTAVTVQNMDDISTLYFQYRVGVDYKKGGRFNHPDGFFEVTTDFTSTEILDPKNVVDMYIKYKTI
ncbi:MAG: hypothetical protein WC977_08890 [Anaerovoracaceae bacterium]